MFRKKKKLPLYKDSKNSVVWNGLEKSDTLESIARFCIRDLSGIQLIITKNDKLLSKLSNAEIRYAAFLIKLPFEKSYQLVYREDELNPTIICHEMKHLHQYESGKLKLTKDYKCIWEGKEYDNTYPYRLRPWEIEAMDAQYEYYQDYKKWQKWELQK